MDLHQSKPENSLFLLQSKFGPNDADRHGCGTLLPEEERQRLAGLQEGATYLRDKAGL